MFWSKYPLLYSLKTRTAIFYTVLLTISFGVVFSIIYLFCYWDNQGRIDRRLTEILSECEYEYITGEEFTTAQIPLRRMKKIPQEVHKCIAMDISDFLPMLAFRDSASGRIFTLIGSGVGKIWQIEVNADAPAGSLRKKQIESPGKVAALSTEFDGESYGEGARISFLLFDAASREVLARSPFPAAELGRFMKFPYELHHVHIQYATLCNTRHRIRIAYRRMFDGRVLVVGLNLHAADENLERIVNAFGIVGGSVLLLSAFCGWLLACRMVRGVEKVGEAADHIAQGDYSRRVDCCGGSLEIDHLASRFNAMLDNTELLMRELRSVADDIAHDLRTPLTRMLGRAEVAISGKQTLSAYRDTLGANAEDCGYMLSLINRMLDITKTESGAAVLHKKRLDAIALLDHSLELFRMVFAMKHQALTLNVPAKAVWIDADQLKMQQLIANLLDNAAKFTPDGGAISVAIAEKGGNCVLTVSDNGCGIPEAEQKLVFKRFYRSDSSRNQPGNGLGLSMVHAVAHAHGGTVQLASTPGQGSVFTVILPLAPPESTSPRDHDHVG